MCSHGALCRRAQPALPDTQENRAHAEYLAAADPVARRHTAFLEAKRGDDWAIRLQAETRWHMAEEAADKALARFEEIRDGAEAEGGER